MKIRAFWANLQWQRLQHLQRVDLRRCGRFALSPAELLDPLAILRAFDGGEVLKNRFLSRLSRVRSLNPPTLIRAYLVVGESAQFG